MAVIQQFQNYIRKLTIYSFCTIYAHQHSRRGQHSISFLLRSRIRCSDGTFVDGRKRQ